MVRLNDYRLKVSIICAPQATSADGAGLVKVRLMKLGKYTDEALWACALLCALATLNRPAPLI